MFKKLISFFILLIITSSTTAYAELAIIVHPDYDGGELNEEMVKEIFLGEATTFPSGHKAIPANHSNGSPDRKYFLEYVLKMGETRHERYWARKKSTGKKGAPDELNSHADVLDWVAKTPLGISYIDKNMVTDKVKALFTVLVFEDL
ncbi:MAG: hypothetical protein OEY66_00370 [Gammaproteobacteria bacterium]|nr:hypothetical protein [Gammaproteobacteria bacterium]